MYGQVCAVALEHLVVPQIVESGDHRRVPDYHIALVAFPRVADASAGS
jgi:hypothetical protein